MTSEEYFKRISALMAKNVTSALAGKWDWDQCEKHIHLSLEFLRLEHYLSFSKIKKQGNGELTLATDFMDGDANNYDGWKNEKTLFSKLIIEEISKDDEDEAWRESLDNVRAGIAKSLDIAELWLVTREAQKARDDA